MFETSPTATPALMADPDAAADRDAGDLSGLLWLIAAGDHHAFQALYAREASRLFAVALRITGEKQVAGEALHDALIQIWRRTVQFHPGPVTADGWLVALVRSRSVESVRMIRRSGRPIDVMPAESIEVGMARLIGNLEADRLRKALATLNVQQREMVVMAFLDGLSAGEMAQRLRLPIGTIKLATRQGLVALRKALEMLA